MALYAAGGLLVGLLLSIMISVAMRIVIRRRRRLSFISHRLKHPQRVVLLLLGIGLAIAYGTSSPVQGFELSWRGTYMHGFLIVMILATAYLVTGIVLAVRDAVLDRVTNMDDTPHARRVMTQMSVIGRVVIALVWVLAVAGALLTFESFRLVGTSLFASAGVASIIAGLAAQSTLSNIFAGIQLAMTDAIRVGDVVVAEGTWGTIDEITLNYVVLRSWDDRRLVLPSTYFTKTPFENWTRKVPQLLGTVEMDLDWLAPVEAMRLQLRRIAEASELWDGRSVGLQVTESTGQIVRIRAVVSAATASNLWDLRCDVREQLISWLQSEAPYALPRLRLEPETTTAPSAEDRERLVEETREKLTEEQVALAEPDAQQTMLLPITPPPPAQPRKGRRSRSASSASSATKPTASNKRPGGDVSDEGPDR